MFYVANSESFISHKNAINKRRILCDAVEDAKDKPLLLLCVGGTGFVLLRVLLSLLSVFYPLRTSSIVYL